MSSSEAPERDIHQVLSEKYRSYRPVKKAPTLYTINGCGVGMYGRRDPDEETGTYIKTHFFTLIYIPILALGAYRVADAAEGGWYFLGKQKLGKIAALWNRAVLTLLIAGLGTMAYSAYLDSPGVRSDKALAKAEEHESAGEYTKAAEQYREIVQNNWPDAGSARPAMVAALDEALASNDPDQVISAVNFAERYKDLKLKAPFEKGLAAVDRIEPTNPAGAAKILERLLPLAPLDVDLSDRWFNLLIARHQLNPGDFTIAAKLAAVYSERGESEGVIRTLEPFQAELATSENRALLGLAYLDAGRLRDAVTQMDQYVQPAIVELNKASRRLELTSDRIWEKELKNLEQGKGPDFFYDAYDAKTGDEQTLYVQQHLDKAMRKHPEFQRADRAFVAATRVVPYAFELALAKMRLAQQTPDETSQKALLEETERMFMDLRGTAGESSEYQLLLAQVKYWLGEKDTSMQMFDEILAAQGRDAATLMTVADIFRGFGLQAKAYQHFEKAYDAASTDDLKSSAANNCYLTAPDDELGREWLEKAGTSNPLVAANLAGEKARQAVEQEDYAEAARHYQKAFEILSALPQDSVVLNNRAMISDALFMVTGEPAHMYRAADDIQQSLEMDPHDSIVVLNALSTLTTSASLRVVSEHLNVSLLEGHFSPDILRMLYSNKAEREELLRVLRNLPEIQTAQRLKDRALTMAPSSAMTYSLINYLNDTLRDNQALHELSRRCHAAQLDTTEAVAETRETFTRTEFAEELQEQKKEHSRYLRLAEKTAPNSVEHHYCLLQALNTQLDLRELGEPQDLPLLLEQARQLYSQRPCALASAALTGVYLGTIDDDLFQNDPAYARALTPVRYVWSARSRVKWALLHPTLSQGVRHHPLFDPLLEHLNSTMDNFPGSETVDDWIFAREINEKRGREIQQKALAQTLDADLILLNRSMNPLSPEAFLRGYFLARMQGDDARAGELLAEAKTNQMPLPAEI